MSKRCILAIATVLAGTLATRVQAVDWSQYRRRITMELLLKPYHELAGDGLDSDLETPAHRRL